VEKHKARRRKMKNLLGPWYQGREEERLNRRQSTTTTSFILPSTDKKKALGISYLVWQSVSNSRQTPLKQKNLQPSPCTTCMTGHEDNSMVL
jgi:hypothetical protein